jgi:hypothetical protein
MRVLAAMLAILGAVVAVRHQTRELARALGAELAKWSPGAQLDDTRRSIAPG